MFPDEVTPDQSLRAAIADTLVLAVLLGIVASAGMIGQVLRGGLTLAEATGEGASIPPGLLTSLAAPLALLTNPDTALSLTAMAVGPLSIGALAATLAWAVAPVAERRFLWSAAAACAVAPTILGYGMIGALHDHVLLAVTTAMTMGSALRLILGTGGTAAGIAMGAWAAMGIWLSPETLPYGLLAFGGVALAWLLTPASPGLRRGIAAAGTALLAVLAVALLIDPPPGGRFAVETDRISAVYLAFGAACCVAGWAIAGLGRTVGATVAVLCLLAWLALFPAVPHGAQAAVAPEHMRAILAHIRALRPFRGLGYVVACLAGGLVAIGLLGWLTWRRHSALLAYAVLGGMFVVALGAIHPRFATYAAALAVALLPVMMTMAARLPARRGAPVLVLARAGLIGCIVLLPWLHRTDAAPAADVRIERLP